MSFSPAWAVRKVSKKEEEEKGKRPAQKGDLKKARFSARNWPVRRVGVVGGQKKLGKGKDTKAVEGKTGGPWVAP